MKSLAKKPNLMFLVAIRGIEIPEMDSIGSDELEPAEFYMRICTLLGKDIWVKKLELLLTVTEQMSYSDTMYKPHRTIRLAEGTFIRYCNSYLHSKGNGDDDYAVCDSSNNKYWFKYGKLHREGGPAFVQYEGLQEWYILDKLHRTDGPAIISANKLEQIWYQFGYLHRIGGPAIIKKDKQYWCQFGNYHRDDGPAVISNHKQKWYTHGVIHRDNGPAIIKKDGCEYWYQFNHLHRDNEPAVITKSKKKWYQFGVLVRSESKLHTQDVDPHEVDIADDTGYDTSEESFEWANNSDELVD